MTSTTPRSTLRAASFARPLALRARLRLQSLEERAVPATYTVISTTDTGTGSGNSGDLRYCLAQANGNAGIDAIVFNETSGPGLVNFLAAPQTITLGGSELPILEAVIIDAPESKAGFVPVTIDANGKSRVFNVSTAAPSLNAVLNGLVITNGSASVGAGILADTSGLILSHCTVTTNTASEDFGGGLYCIGACDVQLLHSTISGNTAANTSGGGGGGIATFGGSLYAYNCTFSSNVAALANVGGGVYAVGASGIDPLQLEFDNCTLDGNAAAAGGGMAAVFCTASLKSCTISDNNTTSNGGGIWLSYCPTELTDCTITGNSATGSSPYFASCQGGGLYAYYSPLSLTGGEISGNFAKGNGGALCAVEGDVTANGCDFKDNRSDGNGGAIYVLGDSLTIAGTPENPAVQLTGNSADGSGGGVFLSGGGFDAERMVLRCDAENGEGGGAFLDGKGFEHRIDFSKFDRTNAAGGNGGGIRLVNGDLTMLACLFVAGSVSSPAALADKSGGGIYASGGTLIVESSAIRGIASAGSGGAIFTTVPTTLTGCLVDGGTTGTVYGGGIYADDCKVTLADCHISGDADKSGGGIYGTGTSTITLTSSLVTSCEADTAFGGGIFSKGSLSLTLSTVSGNTSFTGGGGIYAAGGLTLTQCTVSDNQCNISTYFGSSAGGGILAKAGATISGCTIDTNEAIYGAGLSVQAGSVTVTSSTITGNISYGDLEDDPGIVILGGGGGIAFSTDSGSLSVSYSTVATNSASGHGGGILNQSTNAVTVVSVLFGENVSGQFADDDASGMFGATNCLFSTKAGVTLTTNTDNVLDQPSGLGSLFDYFGGPTKTIPPLPTSNAVDAGAKTASVAYDQRGGDGTGPLPDFDRIIDFKQVSDPRVDIGAFELGLLPRVVLTQPSAKDDGTELSYSRIASLRVGFDQPLNTTVTSSAFTVERLSSPGGTVTLGVTGDSKEGPVTLTFSGSLTEFDSLVDGRYRLTVENTLITTGKGAMAADHVFDFNRFFGDSDNNATTVGVDATDLAAFLADDFADPLGRRRFDFDGDNDVDADDFAEFMDRFGTTLP